MPFFVTTARASGLSKYASKFAMAASFFDTDETPAVNTVRI